MQSGWQCAPPTMARLSRAPPAPRPPPTGGEGARAGTPETILFGEAARGPSVPLPRASPRAGATPRMTAPLPASVAAPAKWDAEASTQGAASLCSQTIDSKALREGQVCGSHGHGVDAELTQTDPKPGQSRGANVPKGGGGDAQSQGPEGNILRRWTGWCTGAGAQGRRLTGRVLDRGPGTVSFAASGLRMPWTRAPGSPTGTWLAL